MKIAQTLALYLSENEKFDIPHHLFTLENGLKVLVVEDHSAPLVNISVLYNVGSKDEPVGFKGFAHLFEHLMFCGTVGHPGSYLSNLLKAGAIHLNGYTARDKTYYYETVPVSSLDYALFAESDRMGYFEESLNQNMLDQQIGIVLNEKEEYSNYPMDGLYEYLYKAIFPVNHPYLHPIIGYKEDIELANLDKAKSWFKKYYHPRNAILTLAGDIDLETAKEKVEKYFGKIESGQPPEHPPIAIPYMHGEVRGTYYGKFGEPSIYFIWQLPAEHDENTVIISALSSLLAGKKTSYLNRILIDEKKLAKEITININGGKLCSQLYLNIKPHQEVKLQEIESEIKILLKDFFKKEITESNLKRIKTKKRTEFIASYEDITYRASILHNSLFIYGNSHAYKNNFNLIYQLDVERAQVSFLKFLTEKVGVFYVLPSSATNKMIKEKSRDIPKIDSYPLIKTPQITHRKLKNGLEIILVERNQSLDINLKVDYAFGSLIDSKENCGRLNFINHLKQIADQDDFNTIEFNQAFEGLGASYGINSSLNWSDAYLYVPQIDFEKTLSLFYKFLFKTKFSEEKFEQEKEKLLFELSQPFATSAEFESYIENALIYPQDHPLAIPDSEKGTYKSIQQLSFNEILKFHQQNHLTKIKRLVVVGAQLEEKVLPLLDQYFGHLPYYDYQPLDLPVVPLYEKSKVYLIQDETLSQDNISLSTMMSPDLDGLDPAYEVLKECFSHSFNGRINLNLREDKTWTYGVRGTGKNIPNATNYGLTVKVEQSHTIDAIKQILFEFYKLLNTEPLTEQEQQNAIRTLNLQLIPRIQTSIAIAQHVLWLARKEFSDHWIEEQQQKYLSQNVKQIQEYIYKHLNNKEWVWIIRGDVLKLKSQIEALGIGDIEVLEIHRENYCV